MPRNSSGTYTLPLPPVVPDTLITADWANTTLADIAQSLTDSLDREGRGGMNSPLRVNFGTEAAPGFAFTAATGTGMWGEAAALNFSVSGSRIARYSATELQVIRPTAAGAGVALRIFVPNTSEGSNISFGADAADNPNVAWQDFNWTTGNARYEFRQSGTAVLGYDNASKVFISNPNPTTSWTVSNIADFNIEKAQDFVSQSIFAYASAIGAGAVLTLGRSKSGTLGVLAATGSGDTFGYVSFEGVNASNARAAGAWIQVAQVGAAGVGNVAADMQFFTGSNAANPTEKLRIMSDGRLYGTALHNNAGSVGGTTNQYIASGTYNPAVTAMVNCGSLSIQSGQWMRVGNVVTFSVRGAVTPSVAGSNTAFTVQLPIPSNLASDSDLCGSAGDTQGQGYSVYANTATDTARLVFTASNTTIRDYSVTCTYTVR